MFTPIRPPVELMSATDIARLDTAWREIVSEMGVQFEHPEALAILAEAGQRVEGETVYFDADWVASKVAEAPREAARSCSRQQRRSTCPGQRVRPAWQIRRAGALVTTLLASGLTGEKIVGREGL